MQSDSHESDPRLQRVNFGPKVATGFVDPCIFFLEATLAKEIPVLFACWARSSSETRKVDGSTHLKLGQVSVVKGTPIRGIGGWTMQDGKTNWNFNLPQFIQELHLVHDDSGWTLKGIPNLDCFQFDTRHGCQSFLKFIDAKTDCRLERLSLNLRRSLPEFAKVILDKGPAEWPTLTNALASFQPLPPEPVKSVPDRSIIRRLISSVFSKKSKPVAV